ncbi:MAG: riboflavin synthase [Magnetococcus sp. WYHC-3]
MRRDSADWWLTIAPGFDVATVRLGDSIAVNGACLTVVAVTAETFSVQVSAESTRVTTLGRLTPGANVNLERALAVGARLDGHIVQGHVDVVGDVEQVIPRGRSLEIWFRVPQQAGRYIVSKGSIAIDGVSLTVNQVADVGGQTRFSVNLIPHTQVRTTLAAVQGGSQVNVETDLLGRYIERLLGRAAGAGRGIDENYLRERGFI